MPSPTPTGHRKAPLHQTLSLNVTDLRVKAYVEAVREHLEARDLAETLPLRNSINELKGRLFAAEENIASMRQDITELRTQLRALTNPDGDDKYALTKAKLIELMKHLGWYE